MTKIANQEDLTKEEVKFLKNQEKRDLKGKKKTKKRRKRRDTSSSSSSSSSSSGSSSDSSSEEEKKKSKRKAAKRRKAQKEKKSKPSSKSMCEVCLIEKAKYRCPKCRILYCAANNDFVCFREHKEKGICEERIEKGLHIKPKTKEDEMDIKEKLALALKRRRKMRKAVRDYDN